MYSLRLIIFLFCSVLCTYKVLIVGGGGVHQKTRAYNSGSVGQDALPGPLHLLVQIVAIPPKILK